MLHHSSPASSRQPRSSPGCLLCSSSKSCPGLSHSRGASAMLDTTSSSSCEDPSDLLLCPLQTPSREAFDSSGDKQFLHVSGHAFPPRMPLQLNRMPTLGSLCATRELGGNIPPVPYGRCLASFLGETQVWLGHCYPFPRSSVVFICAPACRMFPPQCWPAVSPEPRAKDGGAVDTQAGMLVTVPLLWLFEFALLQVD